MSESVLAARLATARCMHDRSVTIPSELSLGPWEGELIRVRLRLMGVFIIIILVYWSECNLPAAVGTTSKPDGMVTDRSCMHRAVQRLATKPDSDIVPDSQ